MRKICLITFLLLAVNICANAFALPDLQVYIPNSEAMDWNGDEDSWFIDVTATGGNFDLYIVADWKNTSSITDGTLLVTVLDTESGTIGGLGTGTFHADLTTLPGTPPNLNHFPVGKPGYDYYTYDIGNFTNKPASPNGGYDYNASNGIITYEGNAYTETKNYSVSVTGHTYLHFDAYAKFTNSANGKEMWKVNPFSHDSTVDPDIPKTPEPASLALFGFGGIGFSLLRKRRKI